MFLSEKAGEESAHLERVAAKATLDDLSKKAELANISEADIQWWLFHFKVGCNIFYNFKGLSDGLDISIHLTTSYINRKKVVGYDFRNIFVVTYGLISDIADQYNRFVAGQKDLRCKNGHLERIGICVTPDMAPIIIGFEEAAHAYFCNFIEPFLEEDQIKTGKYDGTDSYENFVFQELLRFVLENKCDIPFYPLPDLMKR